MLAKINCCRRAGKVTPEDPRRDSVELANVPGTAEPLAAPQEAQAAPQEDHAAAQVHQEAVVEQIVVPTNVIMVQPKPEKAHASIGRQSSRTMMGLKEALKEIKRPGVTVLEDPATEEVAEKVTEPRTLVSRKKKLDSLKKQDSVDPEDD